MTVHTIDAPPARAAPSPPPRVLVIGAGPIGLEAATLLVQQGFAVTIVETGDSIASAVWHWGHVRLFSANEINCTPWGLRTLADNGVQPPDILACPTGAEFSAFYLQPLADSLRRKGATMMMRTKVVSVSRDGVLKNEAVHAVGERVRETAQFSALVDGPNGEHMLTHIAAVLDCSGSYGQGNSVGPGGVPAIGERALREIRVGSGAPRVAWFDSLPDVLGRDRAAFLLPPPYVRQNNDPVRIALVGGGYSAATSLLALLDLCNAEPNTHMHIEWMMRKPASATSSPYEVIRADPLPARAALVQRANRVALGTETVPPNVKVVVHRGATIHTTQLTESGSVRIGFRVGGDAAHHEGEAECAIEVHRLISQCGFKPDLSISRELQVHHCYASEGPMKLASSLLAARVAAHASGDAAAASDCLKQEVPGPALLRTPEPRFYVLGAKSYGRNSAFLLTIGHKQVEAVVGMLEAELGVQHDLVVGGVGGL